MGRCVKCCKPKGPHPVIVEDKNSGATHSFFNECITCVIAKCFDGKTQTEDLFLEESSSGWRSLRGLCPRLYKNLVHFECGRGWFNLIRDLSIQLEDSIRKSKAVNVYAVQVKEKYGGLRFYMSRETPEISELIKEAERLSCETCETCGEPGNWGLRNGFHNVRCEKCNP